jgi:hypothetical protein
LPFQIVSVLLVVLDEQAVRRHVVAVDDDAVSAVLAVQPTPLPWSARQAQMSSRMTLLLFTTRLVVALPGVAPPMRKKTSRQRRRVGREVVAAGVPLPDLEQAGEFVVPASKRMPEIRIPLALARRSSSTIPSFGTSVGSRDRARPCRARAP